MVSKKSIKDATESVNLWDKDNPNATINDKLKRGKQYMEELLEIDFSLSTLPSVILPEPEYIVQKLKKKLKK